MFRFVALFALVAVAAAEPQFYQPWGVQSAAHLKTPSGDTVSVQNAKIQHHSLKAQEYAKKGFLPYAGVVASPVAKTVYSVPATYAAAAAVPVQTYGQQMVYSGIHRPLIHSLGKREAEADSQYILGNTYAAGLPYNYNVYNNGVYGAYSGLTGFTRPLTTYSGIHHLYKREADSDSQFYTANAYGYSPYVSNVYNTAAHVYGGYTGMPYTYNNAWNRFLY